MPNSDALADSLDSRAHIVALEPSSRDRRDRRATRATIEASSPVPTSSGVVTVSSSFLRELSRNWSFSDQHVALLVSAALFVVGAWPLALTEVPPYQDLPNHLAAVTVIENLERYPEFVFNGFFKTNAALFAWLYRRRQGGRDSSSPRGSSRCMVLGANAFVLPRFVLTLTGSRKRMLVASLFMWPMVHNWFVSMGMLDFALAVPLSLGAAPRGRSPAALAVARSTRASSTVLGAVTWYAHVFPLLVVHLLVVIEALRAPSWKERVTSLRAMVLPLLPVTALVRGVDLRAAPRHRRPDGGLRGLHDDARALGARLQPLGRVDLGLLEALDHEHRAVPAARVLRLRSSPRVTALLLTRRGRRARRCSTASRRTS